jgi:multiple sugar transport system substrate-binding protein
VKLSRREFIGVAATSASLLLLGGCGGSGGSGDLVCSYGPDSTGVRKKQIEQFNQKYKGKYSVKSRVMPSDVTQQLQQYRTDFQANSSIPDVIQGDCTWPAELASNNWITDLSNRFTKTMRDKFLPSTLTSDLYSGKIWGVPYWHDSGMLYYRKDLLEKSGFGEPPKTWDQLKEMAQKVQSDSGIKYGLVFQGANYEGGVCNALEYIWSAGGNVLDPNDPHKVVIDSPEAVSGLQMERSMVTDGITPQSVAAWQEDESQAPFLRGEAVFMRQWSYVYALLSDPSQSKIKPEQVGITFIPSFSEKEPGFGCLGDQSLYISTASQNQDAAWKLVEFIANPAEEKLAAISGGYLPTLKSLYNDKEVLNKVPVMSVAKEPLARNKPRPVSPYYSDLSLRMQAQFNDSLKGTVSPEQAAKTLQSQIAQIIKKSNA